MKARSFHVITLGCKVNQYDSQAIRERLAALGMRRVRLSERPDVIVVNTCAVTSRADEKSRKRVRAAARANPGALVLVTGCAATTEPERYRALPGVDHVIETSGTAAARRQIIPSLRRGGKAAIVGVGSDEEVINPSHIHGRAVTLIGSVVFPMGWMWELAQLLLKSRATFEPAVTHRFGLGQAEEALRTADETLGGKVIFLP